MRLGGVAQKRLGWVGMVGTGIGGVSSGVG